MIPPTANTHHWTAHTLFSKRRGHTFALCLDHSTLSMEKAEPSARPHFVGKKEALKKTKRLFVTLEGRDILVIAHKEEFYALDYHCYHAAGPLENGDIEELGGRLCIVCPKHFYKICLKDGEAIYKMVVPSEDGPTAKYASRGVKQRVHIVTETDGDVYVTLSQAPEEIDSDFFQGAQGKAEREKLAAKEAADKAERQKNTEDQKNK